MARTCRIALVGMMGSGKTTIGRLLADRTGWPYHDNDDLLRRLYGATPRQILADGGEAELREAESRALALGLETPEPCIIGAAGGTILDEANRRLLRRRAMVVWLRAGTDVLEARAIGAEHRPWLDTGGASWIREAAKQRGPLYASVADITIETDEGESAATSARVLNELRALDGCPDL